MQRWILFPDMHFRFVLIQWRASWAADLDKQHDEIVKALSDINAFIVEKKWDEAVEMPTKLVDKIVVRALDKSGGHCRQKIATAIRLLGLSTSLTISVKADGRGQCARNGKLPEKAGR